MDSLIKKSNRVASRSMNYALAGILILSLLSPPIMAQSAACNFDGESPTIAGARRALAALDTRCAEEELARFLTFDSPAGARAEALILLGTVYYFDIQGDEEQQKSAVLEQFVAAFRIFPGWAGKLEFDLPELVLLLAEARAQVESERVVEEIAAIPDSIAPIVFEPINGRAWWKGKGVLGAASVVTAGIIYLIFKPESTDDKEPPITGAPPSIGTPPQPPE